MLLFMRGAILGGTATPIFPGAAATPRTSPPLRPGPLLNCAPGAPKLGAPWGNAPPCPIDPTTPPPGPKPGNPGAPPALLYSGRPCSVTGSISSRQMHRDRRGCVQKERQIPQKNLTIPTVCCTTERPELRLLPAPPAPPPLRQLPRPPPRPPRPLRCMSQQGRAVSPLLGEGGRGSCRQNPKTYQLYHRSHLRLSLSNNTHSHAHNAQTQEGTWLQRR
jgi:hypothetical protein